MTEPPDRLQAALADRYAIDEEMGAGGMATVDLAEDLKPENIMAPTRSEPATGGYSPGAPAASGKARGEVPTPDQVAAL